MLGINLYTTITIPAWFITCKYYQDAVNTNKDNPSDLWASRNISGQSPSCIICEDEPVTDKKSITAILNDYFTSIGTNLADKMDNSSYRLNFDLGNKDEIHHYSRKSSPKISKIAKFGREML